MGGGATKFSPKEGLVGQDADAATTFSVLELTDTDVNILFGVFKKLDTGKLNRVTIASVLKLLCVAKSHLSTRIVRSADVDHDGRLSFKEFVLNAWIFATKDFAGVCSYAFDNFDLDGSGELRLHELRGMVKDVHRGEMTPQEIDKHVDELLKAMDDGNHDKIITKGEFCAHCQEFPELLYPAMKIQEQITKMIAGHSFWEDKVQEASRILNKPEVIALVADYERSKSKFKQENAAIEDKLKEYENKMAEAGRQF